MRPKAKSFVLAEAALRL